MKVIKKHVIFYSYQLTYELENKLFNKQKKPTIEYKDSV